MQYRIAICDDMPQECEKYQRYVLSLRDAGYCLSVSTFTSGKDLLAVYEQDSQPFHVIFLDIEMPEMDGHEAAKAVYNKDRSARILMLTSHVDKSDFMKAFKSAHIRSYLEKPVGHKAFCDELSQQMDELLSELPKYFTVIVDRYKKHIEQKDIVYIMVANHTLHICLFSGETICTNMALQDAMNALDSSFQHISRDVAINVSYVSGIDIKDNCVLIKKDNCKTGVPDRLKLAKRHRKTIIAAYMQCRQEVFHGV